MRIYRRYLCSYMHILTNLLHLSLKDFFLIPTCMYLILNYCIPAPSLWTRPPPFSFALDAYSTAVHM